MHIEFLAVQWFYVWCRDDKANWAKEEEKTTMAINVHVIGDRIEWINTNDRKNKKKTSNLTHIWWFNVVRYMLCDRCEAVSFIFIFFFFCFVCLMLLICFCVSMIINFDYRDLPLWMVSWNCRLLAIEFDKLTNEFWIHTICGIGTFVREN